MSYKVVVSDLWVELSQKTILKGVNLNVASGKHLVIMGSSGSGKSVFLKTVIGFHQISAGAVYINDAVPPVRVSNNCMQNSIGVVFQNSALLDDLCVWENVAFRLIYQYRVSVESAKKHALRKLEEVGICSSHYAKFPNELSGGMARRVAIARVLITSPKIIVMDEPTAGLDPSSAKVVANIIKEDLADRTIIIVTHDLALCSAVADEIAFMRDGKITSQYASETEMFVSEDEYVRSFLN